MRYKKGRIGGLKFQILLVGLMSTLFFGLAINLVTFFLDQRALQKEAAAAMRGLLSAKGHDLESRFMDWTESYSQLSQTKFIQDALVSFESLVYGLGADPDHDTDVFDQSYYTDLEKKYSENFDEVLKTHKVHNLHVVMLKGLVIAEASHSPYFGKNLLNGSVKNSPLANCFKKMLKKNEPALEDFSANSNLFICVPMKSKYDRDGYKKDALMGGLLVELNPKIFTEFTDFRDGLGEKGQLILVNESGVARSLPRLDKDTLDFSALLASPGWQYSPLVNSMGNKEGREKFIFQGDNHRRQPSLALVMPVTVFDRQWQLIIEKELNEIDEPAWALSGAILGVTLGLAVIIGLFTWVLTTKVVDRFTSEIGRLLQINSDLTSKARQLARVAQNLEDGTSSQASSIHESLAAIHEIHSLIESNREKAAHSSQFSSKTQNEAKRSQGLMTEVKNSVGETHRTIDNVGNTIQESFSKIRKITELINKIAEKTSIINEIAFQTKLLAFNAAVEAARAGESGKGFAVVAEEVGNLANLSGGTSTEISELVASSVSEVEAIIASASKEVEQGLTETRRIAGESAETVQKSVDDFSHIFSALEEIYRSSHDIDRATQEEAKGVGEIQKAVGLIDRSNNLTIDQTREVLTVSETLQNASRQLNLVCSTLSLLAMGTASSARDLNEDVSEQQIENSWQESDAA